MSADTLLRTLAEITVASSAAILIVGALRKPMRRVAGARVAYWLWLAVPTSVLALWLPVPSHRAQPFAHALGSSLPAVVPPVLVAASAGGSPSTYAAAVLVIWAAGALLLAIWLIYRQQAFVRSLGGLECDAEGFLRSDRIAAPMLIGVWRPQVVVPADFEARYPEEDRTLMLAHERAHRERGDTALNSIATVALLLLWFNPLMYWAVRRFRFDQELACDALVLARSDTSKRRYAHALLKAQLVSDSERWVPVGCHWRPGHPLKERITMLKLASPGLSRRLCGIAFNVLLAASSMYAGAVCFAQPPVQSAPPASRSTNCGKSADKKFTMDAKNTDTRAILAMIAKKGKHNILVSDQVRGGKMTLHLKNVTWQEALNVVTLSEGLVARQAGDITLVDVRH